MFFRKNKKNDGPGKPFLTAGPVLHYSHSNVHRWWWFTSAAYLTTCLFWSKITSGNIDSLQLHSVQDMNIHSLGYFVVNPVSIFEYPWQILVLGFLMAIIAFVPILTAQLLSSRYSVLSILMAAFIAKLPEITPFLTVCVVAVACRPLRFRSRFISIVLCSSPLLIYWGIFGGFVDVDPVKWSLSYSPWLLAWFAGLAICAAVLSIGHYTRYKPGATGISAFVFLVIAGAVFFTKISFAESDYQIYVVRNNPAQISRLHSRSISSIIDAAVGKPSFEKDIFMMFSTSRQTILEQDTATRERLLSELEMMVDINTLPLWFIEEAKDDAYDLRTNTNTHLEQLNYFIATHSGSKRIPIALYYKAMLLEYKPNPRSLRDNEMLEYYSSYPHPAVFPEWVRLYRDYPNSPESLEARWRIAMNMCRKGDLQTSISLCREAVEIGDNIKDIVATTAKNDNIFNPPAQTTITTRMLEDVLFRLKHLIELIENNSIPGNRTNRDRLAEYIGLNKFSLSYEKDLEALLERAPQDDPLTANIKLSLITINDCSIEKCRLLDDFIKNNSGDDSEIEAKYELGLCNVLLWRGEKDDSGQRSEYLSKARAVLGDIVKNHKQSVFQSQAEAILNGLPRKD